MRIQHLSEPVKEYIKSIDEAKNKTELIRAIKRFKLVANDALEFVKKEDFNFDEFKEGRLKDQRSIIEKRDGWDGCEEWTNKYGCVILPEVMLMVSLLANHFCAPWGVAYIQAKSEGTITESGGVATWNKKKEWVNTSDDDTSK